MPSSRASSRLTQGSNPSLSVSCIGRRVLYHQHHLESFYLSTVGLQFLLISAVQQSDSVIHIYIIFNMLFIMIYCRILNIVLCDIQWISFLQKHKMESYIYLTATHIYLNNLSWPFFLLVTDLLHFREHVFTGCMSRGFSLLDITYFGWEQKLTSRQST